MAELWMNFASGVLSADPGVAGTTLASGNMAFLPLVVAPATLRIALDPEGLTGTPEIVVVTAHAASATTCTVVRGQETGYGAGVARSHAVDTVWRMVQTRESIMALMVPAGSIIATVKATADPGFAFLNGQTLANGQVLYPAAWAAIPETWKVAPDIVLPDWRGKTIFMDDTAAAFTLGGVAGANSHAITQAELPAATITIDPPNTVVSIDPPATTISVDPPVTAVTIIGNTGGASVRHTHSGTVPLVAHNLYETDGLGTLAALDGTSPREQSGQDTPDHNHAAGTLSGSVDIPAFNATVEIAPFNANVDIVAFNSGNLGSGAAMSLIPACGVVNFAVKIH